MKVVKYWAARLRRDVHALWLAGRDPEVPWAAKLMAFATAGYALSPIDLIPDFVPVLGYVDDLILLPVGIWLTVKLIPDDVMARLRVEAEAAGTAPQASKTAALLFVACWLAIGSYMSWLLLVYD